MGGQDKGLIIWQQQPLYRHVLQRLAPQVTTVWINANRNLAAYQQSGLTIITDTIPDFAGPLAGMLSALQQAETEWLVFVSCDTPLLPNDLVTQLWRHKGSALAVWARSAERDHPALALVHRDLAKPLEQFLAQGDRRVMQFLQQVGGHSVLFRDAGNAFNNMNRPEDLSSE